MGTLFETLEAEFCPPLDSSLLAACLTDITFDAAGKPKTPSSDEIDLLRSNLREIATQADLSEQFEDVEVASYVDDSADTPSIYLGDTVTSSSTTGSIVTASTTPLSFLQAALPHIDTGRLDKALSDAQILDGDMDMWDVIAGILTAESIREMEERGLDGMDMDDVPNIPELWEIVQNKNGKQKAGKKKKNTTIAIADIRQQHHIRPHPRRTQTTIDTTSTPSSDAWSQLASLATHLASLVPSHQPTFFQSYLHSPKYTSPYTALGAALADVRDSLDYTPDDHIPSYLELLNIILPMYEYLDSDERSRMVGEAELCVIVTEGRDNDALDLVIVLRELDADSYLGYRDRGIYHCSPQTAPPSQLSFRTKVPSGPPPVPPPPPQASKSRSHSVSANKPSPFQWQAVPKRKTPQRLPPSAPAHVPAYTRDVNGMKVKGHGNNLWKGGKGDTGEMAIFKKRVDENMRRRDEMLREATKSWQRGNNRSRGGEVALFFAERARQFQEMAKKDSLELARIKVESKRTDPYSVDLHGTTGAEAVYIVRDIISSLDVSGKPLTVITGRGSHSVNQVSVLKPAVRKALTEDGYSVSSWEGGLYVSRRTHS